MTRSKDPVSLEDLVTQLRRYAPSVPAILAVQLLSNALQRHPFVKRSPLLRTLFENRISIATVVAMSAVAMADMRDNTIKRFHEELKSYVGFPRQRDPSNPFTVMQIGGERQDFTDIDVLAKFIGAMHVPRAADRASRSFDAARRTVISGWNDAYLLRVAEFLATRSIEQSMHEVFGDKASSSGPERVMSLTQTLDRCFESKGTPKADAERFVEFILQATPQATNLYEILKAVINQRDNFAHRCQAEEGIVRLDFAPFQLAQACLQYRSHVGQ